MKKLSMLLIVLMPLVFPLASLAAAPGDVLINEIAWMGTTNSANDEWIELQNTTEKVINLDGWKLVSTDSTPKIQLKETINAGGFYLLERTDDRSIANTPADKIYTGAMGNDGEDLLLYDNSGNLIDRANFSSGWVFGNNDTKQTAERVGTTTWQTSQQPGGTPKEINSPGIIKKSSSIEKNNEPLIKEGNFDNDVAVASAASVQLGASNPLGLFLMVGGIIVIAGAGIMFWKLKNKL